MTDRSSSFSGYAGVLNGLFIELQVRTFEPANEFKSRERASADLISVANLPISFFRGGNFEPPASSCSRGFSIHRETVSRRFTSFAISVLVDARREPGPRKARCAVPYRIAPSNHRLRDLGFAQSVNYRYITL